MSIQRAGASLLRRGRFNTIQKQKVPMLARSLSSSSRLMVRASSSITPPGWSLLQSGAYTRPLAGSERAHAIHSILLDGHVDVCIGVSFTTTIPNVQECFTEGLARVRFLAPLLAANIVISSRDGDSPQFAWVYQPVNSHADAYEWAKSTLKVHEDAPDDEKFIQKLNHDRLPYTFRPSSQQYFGCHLLLRPSGTHSFFLHGIHSILDSNVSFSIFRHILQAAANPNSGLATSDFVSGADIANLPPSVVHVIGEERFAAARKKGCNLPEVVQGKRPGLGLLPQRTVARDTGSTVRVHRTLSPEISSRIFKSLKGVGHSFSVLCDAAQALAAFSFNRTLPEDGVLVNDLTAISLKRFFPSPEAAERHMASAITYVPLYTRVADIHMGASRRHQLIEAMDDRQKQYAAYFADPALPFWHDLDPDSPPPNPNPYVPLVTNLGVLDKYLPRYWPPQGAPTIEVHDLKHGARLSVNTRLMNHGWSYRNKIHWQIESADIYDKEYAEHFADTVMGWILSILDEA